MGSRPSIAWIVRRFPATLLIGAVTAAMFGVEYALGGTTDLPTEIRLGAMRADRVVDHFEVWRLVMPLFLHHGVVHLLLNGLAFLQLGALVEQLWGGRRMILFYVASGIAASMCSAAFNPSFMGAVGASGAILGLAGVLLGAAAYGSESMRAILIDIRPRLWRAVVITLVLGALLWSSGVIPIDNAAHLGGLFTGFLLAAAYPDGRPGKLEIALRGEDRSTGGAILATAVIVSSLVLMAFEGHNAVETLDADTARLMTEQSSRAPGTAAMIPVLVQMLDYYDRADESELGADAFARAVTKYDDPWSLEVLAGAALAQAQSEGVDRDVAARAALERWLEVQPGWRSPWWWPEWLWPSPTQADALNALAWHLVTAHDPARRDPVRAEALSRESLIRITDPATTAGQMQRASYLDTLGEALFQQGRYTEALASQQEAVQLATTLKMPELGELSARLAKIEAASG